MLRQVSVKIIDNKLKEKFKVWLICNYFLCNFVLASEKVRNLIPFETIKYGDRSERESFDIYGCNLPKGK